MVSVEKGALWSSSTPACPSHIGFCMGLAKRGPLVTVSQGRSISPRPGAPTSARRVVAKATRSGAAISGFSGLLRVHVVVAMRDMFGFGGEFGAYGFVVVGIAWGPNLRRRPLLTISNIDAMSSCSRACCKVSFDVRRVLVRTLVNGRPVRVRRSEPAPVICLSLLSH